MKCIQSTGVFYWNHTLSAFWDSLILKNHNSFCFSNFFCLQEAKTQLVYQKNIWFQKQNESPILVIFTDHILRNCKFSLPKCVEDKPMQAQSPNFYRKKSHIISYWDFFFRTTLSFPELELYRFFMLQLTWNILYMYPRNPASKWCTRLHLFLLKCGNEFYPRSCNKTSWTEFGL